jgi:hypothetical protein
MSYRRESGRNLVALEFDATDAQPYPRHD